MSWTTIRVIRVHSFSFHDLFSKVLTLFPLYLFSIFQNLSLVHVYYIVLVYEFRRKFSVLNEILIFPLKKHLCFIRFLKKVDVRTNFHRGEKKIDCFRVKSKRHIYSFIYFFLRNFFLVLFYFMVILFGIFPLYSLIPFTHL